MRRAAAAIALAWLVAFAAARPARAAAPAGSPSAEERLRTAKALVLDNRYAEARDAFQELVRGRGETADSAAYWIARCSEGLREDERALREYDAFLARRPADRTKVEEAGTSRVALSVRLAKAGQRQHLEVARAALGETNRTVRYFAALQLASLGPEKGKPAVRVLQEILANEKDDDLVERAKLALLRVDRSALPAAAPAAAKHPHGREAVWVRIRIYEKGESKPRVAINLPVALADLVFKALPDEAIEDLRKEGYDARSFWEALKKTGPAEILTIEGKDGERIQVWLE